ncbi:MULTISPECIES: hypothetical protein [Chryseobacterium]|uniref:hypothetical protein n=1 Tax=Chryseobacterium TaxID=59732 RepID=UPI001957F41F|nr:MULTISPECIES: hypothetical protein [Chryseobacterium]MBM7419246.1 hypothetical protein [Chryseobacterium sp. JUb44]WSO12018.1 hypothetical protein VUJ64_08935 [Chryseobacterium scophthalmum]
MKEQLKQLFQPQSNRIELLLHILSIKLFKLSKGIKKTKTLEKIAGKIIDAIKPRGIAKI